MNKPYQAIFAIATLSASLAVGTLWAMTPHSADYAVYSWPNRSLYAGISEGVCFIGVRSEATLADEDCGLSFWSSEGSWRFPEDGIDNEWASHESYAWRGFSYQRNEIGPRCYREAAVPAWLMTIVMTAYPIRFSRRWWPRRSVLKGHCSMCGYDLRATPDRCPECGQSVPAGASAAPPAYDPALP